ncbi:hypothetical protein FOCC_FOCC016380 [Frankliniella occidentalis]|nr:hypothetical protein FOCC_FOCC016380 [Frankliniella occidentalis]
MARCGPALLLLLAALAAPALAGPVPRGSSAAPRSPLDLLDDRTRELAPDMADPLPPPRRRAPKKAPRLVDGANGDPYRLPSSLIPLLYQVELTPNFDTFTFDGNALIIVNCVEDTDTIVLHAKELTIDKDAFVIVDDRMTYFAFAQLKSMTLDKTHDFLSLKLDTMMTKGNRYRFVLQYTGILNDNLDGFYRSSYKTADGETRWLATTQFEETGARRAFPCWDEPSFKARFYIIINHDKNRNAVSNMPIVQSAPNQKDPTLIQVQFDGTLPISTYLIAFIVSDFGSVTNCEGNFTLYARKELLDGGHFSQVIGQKALQLLAEYNGIDYMLPKEDQAAIPDFAAGAMENWGLVTYREEYLIEQDSQNARIAEYMMTTICHELGHQWTGDLVTLDWWSHTWLNEGFADYFENYICNLIKPEWHLRDKGVVYDHQQAMEYDVLETQVAMSSPVSSPAEDSSKFDRISYSKGESAVQSSTEPNLFLRDQQEWRRDPHVGVHAGRGRAQGGHAPLPQHPVSKLHASHHEPRTVCYSHDRIIDNKPIIDTSAPLLARCSMFKNTRPEDLFNAIGFEAQKAKVLPDGVTFGDIASTWTEQPGVPVVSAVRDYDKKTITLSQKRFFYAPPNRASLVNQRWFIPVTMTQQASANWDSLKPSTWLWPSKEQTVASVSSSSSEWVLVNPKEIGRLSRVSGRAVETILVLLKETVSSSSKVDQDEVVNLWKEVLNRPEQIPTLFKFAQDNSQLIDSFFKNSSTNSGAVKLMLNCIEQITSTDALNDVTMSPNLDKGIFYGSTDIYLNVNSATSRIALHGTPDLTMKEVQILKWDRKLKEFSKNGNATLKRLSSLEELQRIIVDLTTELEVGEHYLLRFPVFAAYLRDDLKGFYLSTYEDSYGNVVRIGTTQFEPPAARFAFPCFDEPEFKARFKIIIEHDRGLTARSNMPVVRQTRPTLLTVTTEFDETLPMSTYLLAWVVSDFSYVSSKDGTFSTWGRDNLLTLSTSWLSQSVGPAALEGLKDFTGIAYALPKVDQFAIPDFDAGAMENWGLVTYREEYLLESSATDIRIREFIGTTVCHELGHQWTGNLVTLDWWSNTWLNEGFATYFESVICDKIIPEWKLMDKYVTDNVHVGIANDVVPGQLAMSSPVITLDGVEAKFDRISYKKGGAVLRMFEHIMGTETFKKAMHRYLSVNSFKNGSPDRLFRAMDAEIALLAESPLPEGVTFAQVAKTWTEQAGVPVVTATRDYDKAQLTVSQEKFMYAESEDGDGDTLWYVPIPVEVQPKSADWSWSLTAAAANKRWLTPEAPSLSRDLDASKTEWIVLNPRQIGYYLVNYDEANWKLLSAELAANPNALHASSRTQLVHDALALARAGKLSYEVALPFLQSLKLEREATPWRAGVVALTFLRERLTATPAGYALKAFIKDITADAYSAVGFSVPDTWQSFKDFSKDDERFLRYYLASYACDAGNELCAEAAVKALTMSLDEGEMIHADVRTTALCYGVQNSADLFEKVLQEWKSAETSTEQAAHATALACTLEHKLLENVLDDILDGSLVKSSSDLQQLVDAIIVRWENHKFMIDYYKNNWKRIRSL